MAQLFYRFSIEETKTSPSEMIDITRNLPHETEISNYILHTWNDCKQSILNTIPNSLKTHLTDIDLKITEQKDGSLYGVITITPISTHRWSAKTRKMIFENLDAQMTDGFGECIDKHTIYTDPATNTNYQISI